jgi:hypothetical protein
LALGESRVSCFNAANSGLSFESEMMEQQGGTLMDTENRLTPLRVALVAVGIIFIVGVYPLTIVWPSGWAWHMGGPSRRAARSSI